MAKHYDDFSAQTAGVAPAGYARLFGTAGSLLVQADASAPSGKEVRHTHASTHSLNAWAFDAAGVGGGVQEIVVRCQVATVPTSSPNLFALFTHSGTGGDGNADGYWCRIDRDGAVRFYARASTGATVSLGAFTGIFATVAVGSVVCARLRVALSPGRVDLYANAWLGEFSSEPAGWPASTFTTDSTYFHPGGTVGFGTDSGWGGVTDLWWIGAATAGETAPTIPPAPNAAPSQPGALSPASGSTISGTATISWGAATDAEGDTLTYSGRWRLDGGVWTTFGPQSGLSYALPDVADGALDFEVWANDGTTDGATRSGAYTVATAPGTLSITSPTDGATEVYPGDTLTHTAATGADTYSGEIVRVSDSTVTAWFSGSAATSHALPSAASWCAVGATPSGGQIGPYAETYTLRVWGVNGAGDGDPDEITVTIRGILPAPVLTDPAPGHVMAAGGTLSMAWTMGSDPECA